jgi:hypothetical protein
MYTNTENYSVGGYVDQNFLNKTAKGNMNALFAQTTTASLLNPMVSGVISYSANFDPTPPFIGDKLFVGCVGMEISTDSVLKSVVREYRVAVTYTLATNSSSGSSLRVHKKELGVMGKPSGSEEFSSLLSTFAAKTTQGSYTEVSSWKSMTSNADEIWSVHVDALCADDPQPLYSNLGICFQIRTL